jgi:hypothetical protein
VLVVGALETFLGLLYVQFICGEANFGSFGLVDLVGGGVAQCGLEWDCLGRRGFGDVGFVARHALGDGVSAGF